MDQNRLQLAARLLLALLFLVAGIRKALAFGGTAGYFAKLGLPLPELLAIMVILVEIGGAVAVALGWRLRDVALAMGAFTVLTAFIGHPFWAAEPAQFSGQLNNFLKNLAIAGGFLLLAAPAFRPAPSR